MRLTIVGCSGSIPGPDSAASCYLVQAEGFALVLDLGSGALGPLQRHVELASIGAVLLSHLHADHVNDISGLTVASKHGPWNRVGPMPVAGPGGLVARVAEVYGLPDDAEVDELRAIFAFSEVTEGVSTIGPFSLTARRVDHPVEAYAFRIEHDGRTLVYSGDCAPCAGLDDVARDVDLAVIEAAYIEDPDNSPGVHHTGREAGELATRAGVGRLVVTHVPPWLDREAAAAAARTTYAGPVHVARPGDSYEV